MKILKIIFFIFIISVITAVTYYSVVVFRARAYTKNHVLKKIETENFILTKNDLSQRQLEILLAVEDPGFYCHKGIDLSTPGAGITTITQGIVKKLYFEEFRPGIAKIKQSLIARFALDPFVKKDDQITLFINYMYFGSVNGRRADGLAEASLMYYNKPFKRLNEDEYISLIAMIIAPVTFNVHNHPGWNSERSERIKKVISGQYKPMGLMDQYYGELSDEIIESGIAPMSYFKSIYKKE